MPRPVSVITTTPFAVITTLERPAEPQPGSDAEDAEWIADWRKVRLAFNHADILADAMQLEEGEPGWGRRVVPPETASEDEAYWRGLERKLRRP